MGLKRWYVFGDSQRVTMGGPHLTHEDARSVATTWARQKPGETFTVACSLYDVTARAIEIRDHDGPEAA